MQQLSQLPAEAMPDVLKQLEAGLKAAPAEFHPAIFHLIGKVKERMAAD
jgi:hypothetical protein